jgi:pimeloyl-ACP methyl ester carboxylesterase
MLESFDMIAFDPRGVLFSTPINCLGDKAERDRINGLSPDVTTSAGFAQAQATARQIAQQCSQKYGTDLADFNTTQTARDLDQIRQAVGDSTMNYLGFSYGTELGSVYAHLFPSHVRVAVLDGAVDPLTSDITRFADQIKGFELAFDQFAAWCRQHSPCQTLGNPRQAVYDLVKQAKANPIPSSAPKETRKATQAYVLTGVLYALYSQSLWKNLGDALISAGHGDARGLFDLADQYNQRYANGYTNIADANTAIGCNDSKPGPADEVIRMTATTWTSEFPMFGKWSAAGLFSCQQWQPDRTPEPLPSAPTPTKVLVVGNTHDPATPYQGALDLAKAMGNADVLSWDGEGHTSYLQGSSCVDDYVENYLIDKKLPPAHTTCPR